MAMSVDYTLRCDEVLESPGRHLNQGGLGDPPHFCRAFPDRAILDDERVMGNMLALEGCYIPDLDWSYMRQSEIRLHMRKTVAEWMLDVCVDQACQSDVFLLSTNIMDRFLGTITLRKEQFQLLGAACIFLASKMIEPRPISATALVKSTADTYDKDELLQMELLILSKLKWDLTAVTAYDYLDHLMNTVTTEDTTTSTWDRQTTATVRSLAERIVLLCATDSYFATVSPSLIASAAFVAAVQNASSLPSSSSSSSQRNRVRVRTINLNSVTARLKSVAKFDSESLRECVDKIEDMIRSGQTGCDPADKDKGQSTVDEEDEDDDDQPPTMTSTPIKDQAAPAASHSSSAGTNSTTDESEGKTSTSNQHTSRPVDIRKNMEMMMEVENNLSTPTDVYKVSAYCATT